MLFFIVNIFSVEYGVANGEAVKHLNWQMSSLLMMINEWIPAILNSMSVGGCVALNSSYPFASVFGDACDSIFICRFSALSQKQAKRHILRTRLRLAQEVGGGVQLLPLLL